MGGNFKFQAQDSFSEYLLLRFGDLKKELHFLKNQKKPTLVDIVHTKYFY